MSEPFIGEIRAFPYPFLFNTSEGWLPCRGQLFPVAQYQALYSVIGNLYLPPGKSPTTSSFYLPNPGGYAVQGVGKASGGQGSTYTLGQTTGHQDITLNYNQMPSHTHQLQKQNPPLSVAQKTSAPLATSNFDSLVQAGTNAAYYANTTAANLMNTPLSPEMIGAFGAAQPQPHDNMQPYLCVTFYIAYDGIYPVRQ